MHCEHLRRELYAFQNGIVHCVSASCRVLVLSAGSLLKCYDK